MSNVHLTNAGIGDLFDLREFSARSYRKNDITFAEDYFDWQFNHCGGIPQIDNGALIARKDGRIVGNCLVPGYQVSMNGHIRRGAWIHEWFVDSGLGAAGLLMLRQALKGLDFFAGAGISSHGLAAMRAICPNLTLFALGRMFAVFKAQETMALSFATRPQTLSYLRGLRLPPSSPAVKVTDIASFDADYDEVWEAFRRGVAFTTDRSSVFMNWRYCRHPRFTYHSVRAEGPAGVVYCVWRKEQVHGMEIAVARICEVIGGHDAIVDAMPSVLAVIGTSGVAFADFFCSNARVMAATLGGGMQPAVSRPDFVLGRLFQPLADTVAQSLDFYFHVPGADRPLDYSGCYFTKGDSNQDRPNII